MLENVVVAVVVLLAVAFLARKFFKTWRKGECPDCGCCKNSEACSCCSACLDRSEDEVKDVRA